MHTAPAGSPLGRWLRLAAALAVAAAAGALGSSPAVAHPLGNFSVNRYARLELTPGVAHIYYVLDMAEIPTFIELDYLDADLDDRITDAERGAYAAEKADRVRAGLRLTVNGEVTPLTVVESRAELLPGQGGLRTLRFEALYLARHTAPSWDAEFRDDFEPDRPGWREIVVRAGTGASLVASTVPDRDVSDALTRYPDPDTQTPLNVREARFTVAFTAAEGPAGAALPPFAARTGVPPGAEWLPFAVPLAADMPPLAAAAALLAAAALGAVHALSPGHGKSIVAAYLVGTRGTVAHAALLGLTVTVTHTAGVYLLGVVTLVASAYVLPERLYPLLGLASGLMVAAVGLALLQARLRWALGARHHREGDHAHHPDQGPSAHGHSHAPAGDDGPLGLRGLVALGVSGGLVPCPSALVIMLSAIALRQTGLGLVLILAFSVGLAAVVTGLGVALVLARERLERARLWAPAWLAGPLLRAAPVAAAAAVVLLGVAITVRSAAQL